MASYDESYFQPSLYDEYYSEPIPYSKKKRESTPDVKFSLWHTFKHHIPYFILTIIFDLVLPLVLFFVLYKRIGTVYALLVAGAPPLVMIVLKGCISRRFDILGFLILIAFVVSGIVALVTNNATILLLEKSLVTGVVSIICALTLFPCSCWPCGYLPCRCCPRRCVWRPIAYFFYKDLLPTKRKDVGLPDDIFDDRSKSMDGQYVDGISERRAERKAKRKADRKEVAQVYDWMYTNCRSFRCSCYILTIIWAIGFMLEFLGRLALILAHLTTKEIVIWGHVILGVVVLICGILSIICLIIERRKTLRFIKQWKDGYYYNNIRERRQRRQDYVIWTSH